MSTRQKYGNLGESELQPGPKSYELHTFKKVRRACNNAKNNSSAESIYKGRKIAASGTNRRGKSCSRPEWLQRQ